MTFFFCKAEIHSSGFELQAFYFIFKDCGTVFVMILYEGSSTILPKRVATFLLISLLSSCFY